MPRKLTKRDLGRRFMASDDDVAQRLEDKFLSAARLHEEGLRDSLDPAKPIREVTALGKMARDTHAKLLTKRPDGAIGVGIVLRALLDREYGIVDRLTDAEADALSHAMFVLWNATKIDRHPWSDLRGFELGGRRRRPRKGKPRVVARVANVVFVARTSGRNYAAPAA